MHEDEIDDRPIEYDDDELRWFAALPREEALAPGETDRAVARLRREGFFVRRRVRRDWIAGAIAAALVLFAAGVAVGNAIARRNSLEVMLARTDLSVGERVLLLQRAGSAYVHAAQSYADATAHVDSSAIEVASRVLIGAAHAVARNGLDAGLGAPRHGAPADTHPQTRHMVLIMSKHSRMSAGGMLLLAAARIGAQQAANCLSLPGAPYGIVSISCPSCTIAGARTSRRTVTFNGEPVVLETRPGSAFLIGDIIEAVNGRPITTVLAAEEFAFPRLGANEITVRRGRDQRVIPVTIAASAGDCASAAGTTRAELGTELALRVRAKLDSLPRRSEPLIYVDGELVAPERLVEPVDPGASGGYGFAVACVPSCTAATATEGKTTFGYYRYGGTPPIIAVRHGGPADRAGVKVGDVILKVDGVSILEDAAAERLASVVRRNELRLTALHERKEVEYLLKFP